MRVPPECEKQGRVRASIPLPCEAGEGKGGGYEAPALDTPRPERAVIRR
jgi:hypothetical protein